MCWWTPWSTSEGHGYTVLLSTSPTGTVTFKHLILRAREKRSLGTRKACGPEPYAVGFLSIYLRAKGVFWVVKVFSDDDRHPRKANFVKRKKRKRRDILGHRKGVSSKCQEESVETCIALKFSGAALSISGFLERLQKPLWKMSCQDIQW